MKPLTISKFLGLVDTAAPERLKPGELMVALDVDVDGDGALRTRQGQTLVSAVASHSMYSAGDVCVVVQGQDMKRMDTAGGLTQLVRLAYGGPVSYAELNGVIYFSNGVDTGRIAQGRALEWGVRRPIGQPVASATGGALPPGRYLYAMTFVRADGQESGAQVPGALDLPSGGGIAFSQMEVSSDPEVAGKVLYISAPNGVELYRVATGAASASSYTYNNAGLDLGWPLDPETVEPAPAGTIVEIHGGVAYVVDGSVAWASELYNLERFRRAKRFVQAPGPINLFASVETGVYMATDRGTWYLDGTTLDFEKSVKVLEVGAVPGTLARMDSGERGDAETPVPTRPMVMWMSPDGVIAGYPGGDVRKMTADDFGIPASQRGAAMIRADRGYVSYIASVKGSAPSDNQFP